MTIQTPMLPADLPDSATRVSRRRLATGLVAGALAAGTATAGTSIATRAARSADGELLALGAEIERLNAHCNATWDRLKAMYDDAGQDRAARDAVERHYDAVLDRRDEIWSRMAGMPATTLAGLIAKAAYGLRHLSELDEMEVANDAHECGIAILRDLAALRGTVLS